MKLSHVTIKKVLIIIVASPFVGVALLAITVGVVSTLYPERWAESMANVETERAAEAQMDVKPVIEEPKSKTTGISEVVESIQSEPIPTISIRVGDDNSPQPDEIVIGNWGAYELTDGERRSSKIPSGNDAYSVPISFNIKDGITFFDLGLTLTTSKGETFYPCPNLSKDGNAATSRSAVSHCVYGPDTQSEGVTFVSAQVNGYEAISPINLYVSSYEDSADYQIEQEIQGQIEQDAR